MQLIINWVHADDRNRKEHFLPLLRQLRFPAMDLEELEAIPREVMEFQEIRDEVSNELSHEKRDLSIVRFMILSTDMCQASSGARSLARHPVELDLWPGIQWS